jgi:hypothetical protein
MDEEVTAAPVAVDEDPTTDLVLEIRRLLKMVHLRVRVEQPIPAVVAAADQHVTHLFHHHNQHMTQQMDISNALLVEQAEVAWLLLATQSAHLVHPQA